jgi:hypothetical protein
VELPTPLSRGQPPAGSPRPLRERILDALERTPGIPGRFEPIDAGQDFDVIIDLHRATVVRRSSGDSRVSRESVTMTSKRVAVSRRAASPTADRTLSWKNRPWRWGPSSTPRDRERSSAGRQPGHLELSEVEITAGPRASGVAMKQDAGRRSRAAHAP